MVTIDMTGLLGEALRATGAEQPSILHSGINVQAEIRLRICIGENSAGEMGQDEKDRAVHLEGDVIYGGKVEQQEAAGNLCDKNPAPKEGKK